MEEHKSKEGGVSGAKIVLVLIDGLSDTNNKDIGCKALQRTTNIDEVIDKTPLQEAKIPYMDAIAKSGINGVHDPV